MTETTTEATPTSTSATETASEATTVQLTDAEKLAQLESILMALDGGVAEIQSRTEEIEGWKQKLSEELAVMVAQVTELANRLAGLETMVNDLNLTTEATTTQVQKMDAELSTIRSSSMAEPTTQPAESESGETENLTELQKRQLEDGAKQSKQKVWI